MELGRGTFSGCEPFLDLWICELLAGSLTEKEPIPFSSRTNPFALPLFSQPSRERERERRERRERKKR